jgi:hypothetical protein
MSQIRNVIAQRDAGPLNVALQFQLIRASQSGVIDPAIGRIADALGELLRFTGYELMSEAVVSAAERGDVQQSLDGGGMPLQLGVQVRDVRGSAADAAFAAANGVRRSHNGSVELGVELTRPGSSSAVLTTNVVIPTGQTVVLGTAYPGGDGTALILTVRGQIGPQELGGTRRRTSGQTVEPYMRDGRAADQSVRVAPSAEAHHRSVDIVVPARTRTGTDVSRGTPVRTKSSTVKVAPAGSPPAPPPF